MGRVFSKKAGRFKQPQVTKDEHFPFVEIWKEGQRYRMCIPRLVVNYFILNRENGIVEYINPEYPLDMSIFNIKYKGEYSFEEKMVDEFLKLKKEMKRGMILQLAKKYNLHPPTVRRILKFYLGDEAKVYKK